MKDCDPPTFLGQLARFPFHPESEQEGAGSQTRRVINLSLVIQRTESP